MPNNFASQQFEVRPESQYFEELQSGENYETSIENLSDADILKHFDESQLDYINELQDNPSWQEMSIEEKIESIKVRVEKFCRDTGIDKIWTQPSQAYKYAYCLLRHMR